MTISWNLVVPFKTHGFMMDARVYHQNIKNSKIYISDDVPKKADVNLFIDRVMNNKWFGHSLINVLMVNQEVILAPHLSAYQFEKQYLKKIDIVLCKTNYGYEFMQRMRDKYNFRFKILYVGHTTIFPTIPPGMKRDYSTILHSAGAHNWKNTDTVIKAWLKHGKKLNLPEVVITCHKKCLTSLKKYLEPNEFKEMLNHDLITFYQEPLDFKDLVRLKHEIGMHLCPSMAEGYGHYLNEARICKAAIITTDIPPMNELVDSDTGLLLPCYKTEEKSNGNPICFIDPYDLAEIVKKLADLPIERKKEMGELVYQDYLYDTKDFEIRIHKFVNKMEKMIEESRQELKQSKKRSKRSPSKSRSRKRSKPERF